MAVTWGGEEAWEVGQLQVAEEEEEALVACPATRLTRRTTRGNLTVEAEAGVAVDVVGSTMETRRSRGKTTSPARDGNPHLTSTSILSSITGTCQSRLEYS